MAQVITLALDTWDAVRLDSEARHDALSALESGQVVFFPGLDFDASALVVAFDPQAAAGARKNLSFDSATQRMAGMDVRWPQDTVKSALARYADAARTLIGGLFPAYQPALVPGRTSFRPEEIQGRKTSWRKDDARLHVDSFPATPVQGKRILRVFTNVNPHGESRHWRTGEPFERVAARFVPHFAPPVPGSGAILQWLHITKSRRTPYDHYMLKLHDAMKADLAYQRDAEQRPFAFPAGSTWIVYTDQVSHAAMQGRWAFEQTFYLPVAAMHEPALSPLRTLERLAGRALA